MTLPTLVQNSDGVESIVYYEASWDFYEAMLREYDEEPSRMSFDDGTLEILMTISMEHEGFKQFIGAIICQIAQSQRIPMARRGSATLKSLPKRKGLEADQCYWIANEQAIRGVKRLDLNVHPPPDLVVEIDITHSVVDREAIYAAIGVPEMWHYADATKLTAWALINGAWERIDTSRSFPMIRMVDLNPFIERFAAGDEETAILVDFRRSLEQQHG
ncbi:MAG: Uma2 family endonuclease [Planctomycetota bacterium]|nr:Uma2 family endonuclease [Planctomycetota bacterium]